MIKIKSPCTKDWLSISVSTLIMSSRKTQINLAGLISLPAQLCSCPTRLPRFQTGNVYKTICFQFSAKAAMLSDLWCVFKTGKTEGGMKHLLGAFCDIPRGWSLALLFSTQFLGRPLAVRKHNERETISKPHPECEQQTIKTNKSQTDWTLFHLW